MPRCCSGSPGRQRFDHHGVVQGQVQQVEDQQHRRKRYRLQKVWTQGNVAYCYHRGVIYCNQNVSQFHQVMMNLKLGFPSAKKHSYNRYHHIIILKTHGQE